MRGMWGMQAMDGKRGSMCTDTDRFRGKKVGCDAPLACEAMIGPLLHSGYGYCTDLNIGKFGMTGAMRASKVAQRRTANGVPCRLPLMYKCVPPPCLCCGIRLNLQRAFLQYRCW